MDEKNMKITIFSSTTFLRNLTNIWTIIFFAAIIYDFCTHNSLDKREILLPIAVMYDAVLAVYSAEKEFKRWHDSHTMIHPGELYIILWTILVFGLLGTAIFGHVEYNTPTVVSASYIVAIGVLAITKESKHFYRRTRLEVIEKEPAEKKETVIES